MSGDLRAYRRDRYGLMVAFFISAILNTKQILGLGGLKRARCQSDVKKEKQNFLDVTVFLLFDMLDFVCLFVSLFGS